MDDLREAAESIREHHSGKITLRSTTVQAPKPILMSGTRVQRIRRKARMSQAVFARCLHTSRRTLEKWEQGRTTPTGSAAALLMLVDRHPEVLGELARMG